MKGLNTVSSVDSQNQGKLFHGFHHIFICVLSAAVAIVVVIVFVAVIVIVVIDFIVIVATVIFFVL